MQADNAPTVERQLSMLLSLTATLLHVVILQSHLIYLWLRIKKSVDVDTPPTPTQTHMEWLLPYRQMLFARASAFRSAVVETQARLFFRGTHLVTDLKPLAPPTECTVVEVSSALCRRSKKLAQQTRKKQYL